MGRGYMPAKHSLVKRICYINTEAEILNSFGQQIPKFLYPNMVSCMRHGSNKRYWRINDGGRKGGNIKVADIMLATFVREVNKAAGEEADHINGNALDDRLVNLRIVDRAINQRDGGFARKLRNKGIDPTMFASSFLLRYFDRMAEYKASHTRWQYERLTREELLEMLVGPEFKINHRDILLEEEKRYD